MRVMGTSSTSLYHLRITIFAGACCFTNLPCFFESLLQKDTCRSTDVYVYCERVHIFLVYVFLKSFVSGYSYVTFYHE